MNRSPSTTIAFRSLLIPVALAAPGLAQGPTLKTFANGQVANATDVNANFTALKDALAPMSTLGTALTADANKVSINSRRLSFDPAAASGRKIVLFEGADNDHQFLGFGINPSTLLYQLNATGDNHVFKAATSPTASNELMRIQGNGNVGIGQVNPTQRLHVTGNLRLDTTAGQGRFYFGDPGEGTDPIYFDRTNPSSNVSHVRLAIGDDASTSNTDRFEIGTATGASGFTAFATFASSGRLGIGTANPSVPLDVVGSNSINNTGTTSYFLAGNTTLTVSSNNSWFTSIRASSGIVAGDGVLTASDERIKDIQGRSDSAADLGTLLGIEVADYLFKDVVEKGNRLQKKVIAQQVEKVFPAAVRKTTDVVPDIFAKAPISNGWVALTTDLKVGDRVRLITEKGERAVHEVLEIEADRFRTDFVEHAGQVFVYGREVNDFRVVDYESIAMLNVSATQELARQVEALATENAELKARLANLEALADEVAKLKASFAAK